MAKKTIKKVESKPKQESKVEAKQVSNFEKTLKENQQLDDLFLTLREHLLSSPNNSS